MLVNIRSPSYFIARAPMQCQRCGQPCLVLALAVPPQYEWLHEAAGEPLWQAGEQPALLSHCTYIPPAVQRRLAQDGGALRQTLGTSSYGSYWANHCLRCMSAFSDHELHCEPGGAFCIVNEAGARAVSLRRINSPLAVGVDGVAPDPAFFAQLRRL